MIPLVVYHLFIDVLEKELMMEILQYYSVNKMPLYRFW